MKAYLTSYLDYRDANFTTQIEYANKLNIKHLVIRNINGSNIITLSEHQIDLIKIDLEKSKLSLYLLDPSIKSYEINDQQARKIYLETLEKGLAIAKNLKAAKMTYQLPIFGDVTKDKNLILSIIKEDLSLFKKYKIQPLLTPSNQHKTNQYRYLLDEIKTKINFLLDPRYLYLNKEPITTCYRLLRPLISDVIASDIDQLKQPRLIGFGKLDIYGLFKRLHKNNYQGFVIYDSTIFDLVENQTVSSKPKFFSFFSKTKKAQSKIHYDLVTRVKSDQVIDILYHQLTILNVILFNKKSI